MKRFLQYFLIALCLFPLWVDAKDTKLSLLKDHDVLCYDGKTIKDEDLMKEMDLTSSEVFKNELVIENTTGDDYQIYFLLSTKEQDGSFNDLLDYLTLKVYVDDKVVYDGTGSVIDFATEKEDLHDFISLGSILKASSSVMRVEASVSNDYASVSNNTFAYLIWEFYIRDKDKEFIKIEELSTEQFYNWMDIWVFCLVCIIVAGIILFIYYRRKKRSLHPVEDSKKEKKEEN